MKNWKLKFTFDGYRFWDVVKAESADQAIAYHAFIVPDSSGHVAEETDEIESYVVPDGWQRPKRAPLDLPSEEEVALFDRYTDWVWDNYDDPEIDCDVSFEEWRDRYAS